MKKVIAIILLASIFSSCGNNIKPIAVNYEVGSISQYEADLKNSRIKRSLTDNQLLEIGYIANTNAYNLYNTVLLPGNYNQEVYNKIKGLYKDINILFLNDLKDNAQIKLNGNEEYQIIVDALQKSNSVYMKNIDVYIPSLNEISECIKKSKYPKETVISIMKELQ